jgi:hypothetical protein
MRTIADSVAPARRAVETSIDPPFALHLPHLAAISCDTHRTRAHPPAWFTDEIE